MEPTPLDREESRRQIAQAERALARRDIAAAIPLLEAAWKHDPHNAELPLMAATLHLQEGEAIRAAHRAVEAFAVRPFNPSALDVLAVACSDALQPELAQRILRRAIRMAPGMANAKRNLEETKQRAKEIRQAAVPKQEILRAAHFLPQKAIARLLEDREPRLTACIVIREGDDALLQVTLESARSVASSIVIVDAREDEHDLRRFAAEETTIHALRGVGPGGEPFDAAIRLATTDWILVLEAGERLGKEAGKALSQAMRRRENLAYFVEVRTEGRRPRRSVRLMRNAPDIRFCGRLEPQADPALGALEARWGLTIGSGEFCISRAPGTSGRTTPDELLQLVDGDLAQNSSSRRARLERARLLMAMGKNEDALREAGRVRRELRGDPLHRRAKDLEEPTIVEGCCLMRLARVDELETLISEYHSEYTPTTDTLFLEGVVATARQDNEWAVDSFRRALETETEPSFAAGIDEVRASALPNMLGAALMARNDADGAREAFDLALTREPDNLEAQLGRVSLRLASREIRELLEDLDRLIESRGADARVWVTGGVILSQLPQLGAATVAWHEEAVNRFPDHRGLRRQLGDALLRTDNAERAIETWPDEQDEDSARIAARVAASLACGRDLPQVADDDRQALIEQVLAWFGRLLSYGAERSLDRALLDLHRAEPSIPGLVDTTADWLDRVGQTEAAQKLRTAVVGV